MRAGCCARQVPGWVAAATFAPARAGQAGGAARQQPTALGFNQNGCGLAGSFVSSSKPQSAAAVEAVLVGCESRATPLKWPPPSSIPLRPPAVLGGLLTQFHWHLRPLVSSRHLAAHPSQPLLACAIRAMHGPARRSAHGPACVLPPCSEPFECAACTPGPDGKMNICSDCTMSWDVSSSGGAVAWDACGMLAWCRGRDQLGWCVPPGRRHQLLCFCARFVRAYGRVYAVLCRSSTAASRSSPACCRSRLRLGRTPRPTARASPARRPTAWSAPTSTPPTPPPPASVARPACERGGRHQAWGRQQAWMQRAGCCCNEAAAHLLHGARLQATKLPQRMPQKICHPALTLAAPLALPCIAGA